MNLRRNALAVLTILSSVAASANADLIFVGSPGFTTLPYASGAVAGVGAGNMGLENGGAGPNFTPIEATPNGFKFTNSRIVYTTVAADAGNLVNIDWVIERSFVETLPDGIGTPAITKAALSGSVSGQLPGGALFPAHADVGILFNQTDVPAIPGSLSAAFDGPLAAAAFANGPNASLPFVVPDGSDQVLRQRGHIEFNVPAARPVGSKYMFTLPNSWDSEIIPVPEPATAIPMSFAPLAIGFRQRRTTGS